MPLKKIGCEFEDPGLTTFTIKELKKKNQKITVSSSLIYSVFLFLFLNNCFIFI